MKLLIPFALIFLNLSLHAQNNTGIGTTNPNSNALLELDNNSNPLGLLLPRQDISTFVGLGAGENGLMVFNTGDNKVYTWDGTTWVSGTSEWGVNGTDIFNLNSGNVGIGVNIPSYKLTVVDNTPGAIVGFNSSASNTLMDFNNTGTNPASWRFGYLGNTGGNPGFMTFLRGSHRFVITNNGDVGIAETNPQARLEINSSGNSSASFGLLMSNSSLNPTLTVRDDGHVGIGTSVPDATLTVIDNQQLNLQIQSSSTVGTWLSMNNSSVGGEWFHVINTGSANGEGVGKLIIQRGTNGGTASGLFMAMDHASLNIGINDSNPLEKLHLYDPSDPTIRLTSSTSTAFSNAANSGTIQLLEANSDPGVAAYGGGLTYDGSNNTLSLQTYNGATTIDALSILRSSGFVGIGTTVPTSNLHVLGTGLITGRLELTALTDASGSGGSGVLEIGGSLRLDGNEIITNTNSTLFLQNDNNGDFRVDASSLVVDASENRVGINETAPGYRFHVSGPTGSFSDNGIRIENSSIGSGWSFYASSSGAMLLGRSSNLGTFNGTTGAYTATSDARLKKNIRPIEDVLDKVMNVSVKKYQFIHNEQDQSDYIGVLAQDLQKDFPEFVSENVGDEGNPIVPNQLGVDYAGLSVIAIKAIQELKAENEKLKARIEALESK